MSSSSLYEPDEDEASDSDTDHQPSRSKLSNPPSSPQIQHLRLSSETGKRDNPIVEPQTREEAYGKLCISLSGSSLQAYSNILAETINDVPPVPANTNLLHYGGSQLGAVFWSNREKDIFFRVLQRKGENGIKEIANAIGTKSELEVQDFLQLLHKGLEQQQVGQRRYKNIVLGDAPAAAEIGVQCCEVLDQYAELLSFKERKNDDSAGFRKYQDTWIVDRAKAYEIESKVKGEDDNVPTYSSAYLIARFLHMENWITLSERVFMNSGGTRAEDNWTNLAFADEVPSMTAEAFDEFFALLVNVTRRVVHSAIFFAMSRSRSSRRSDVSGLVKKADVRAALDVLNMKRSKYSYWVDIPRKYGLEVSDIRHVKGWQQSQLSHDEVEDYLSKPRSERESPTRKISGQREGRTENPSTERDGYSDDESTHSSSSSPVSLLGESEDELPADLEAEHAEQLDHKTSSLEEIHLWRALDRPMPAHLDIPVKGERSEDEGEGNSSTVRRPVRQRKSREELVGWRNRTLYRNDWEEYGNGIFDIYKELSENRRKRRRTEDGPTRASFSLSDSDADTEADYASVRSAKAKRARTDHDTETEQADDGQVYVDADQVSDYPGTTKIEASDPEVEREAEHLNQMLEHGSKEYDQGINPVSSPPRTTRTEVEPEPILDQNTYSEGGESTRETPSPERRQRTRIYPKERAEDEEPEMSDAYSGSDEGSPEPRLFSSRDLDQIKVETQDSYPQSGESEDDDG